MFNPYPRTESAGENGSRRPTFQREILVAPRAEAADSAIARGRDSAGARFAVHIYTNALWSGRMSALILVVDDEPDVADLFRQQFRRDLRANRFLIDFALSAEEALGKVESASQRTDLILILSDINMPGMSGLDMLPKAREARPDVPVIMITAYGDAETRRRAAERGAAGLFTKPIDFPELRRTIDGRLAQVGSAE